MNDDTTTLTDASLDLESMPTTLPEIEAKITNLQTQLRKMAKRGSQLEEEVNERNVGRLEAAAKVAERGTDDAEAQNEY